MWHVPNVLRGKLMPNVGLLCLSLPSLWDYPGCHNTSNLTYLSFWLWELPKALLSALHLSRISAWMLTSRSLPEKKEAGRKLRSSQLVFSEVICFVISNVFQQVLTIFYGFLTFMVLFGILVEYKLFHHNQSKSQSSAFLKLILHF